MGNTASELAEEELKRIENLKILADNGDCNACYDMHLLYKHGLKVYDGLVPFSRGLDFATGDRDDLLVLKKNISDLPAS